jgi:hypothetical protein
MTAKAKKLDNKQIVDLLEMLPLDAWTAPDLSAWSAAFQVHYSQGSAAMRRALGLDAVLMDGAVAVDERHGYAIGRIYLLGTESRPTRVYWRRSHAQTPTSTMLESAKAALCSSAFLVDKVRRASLFYPTSQPVQPVHTAAPMMSDADMMRDIQACRERIATTERSLMAERDRLSELERQRVARVQALETALRALSIDASMISKAGEGR